MFLIAALVLLLAGPWFEDQHTVGYILLIPFVFELLVYGLMFGVFGLALGVGRKAHNSHKRGLL